MFLLAELKDTIRIPPEIFHMKLIDAVKDEINRKLANKVKNELFTFKFYCNCFILKLTVCVLSIGIIKCWPVHCVERHNPCW